MTLDQRPYQTRDVEQLGVAYTGGARAACYCLPTGGGKTVVFAHISHRVASKGHRTAILTHRRELVRQASDKLTLAGVPHGILAAGLDRDHDAPTWVMSASTALRRFEQLPEFHFIILDECQHSVSASWMRLLSRWPQAKILGVTATPERLDGKGLGVGAGDPFDTLVTGATVVEQRRECSFQDT
jgi:DNA repair protein RadD